MVTYAHLEQLNALYLEEMEKLDTAKLTQHAHDDGANTVSIIRSISIYGLLERDILETLLSCKTSIMEDFTADCMYLLIKPK